MATNMMFRVPSRARPAPPLGMSYVPYAPYAPYVPQVPVSGYAGLGQAPACPLPVFPFLLGTITWAFFGDVIKSALGLGGVAARRGVETLRTRLEPATAAPSPSPALPAPAKAAKPTPKRSK